MVESKGKYRLLDWRGSVLENINVDSAEVNMKRSSSRGRCYLVLFVLMSLCIDFTSGSDYGVPMGCRPSKYILPVSKNITKDGQDLYCFDNIVVLSCRGRCDSYEYGDFKIPYKISSHPVCMYNEISHRLVRLRHCHPDHPQPYYQVFDARSCSCKLCNSEYTSCENLNG